MELGGYQLPQWCLFHYSDDGDHFMTKFGRSEIGKNFYFTKVFASPDQRPTDLHLRTIHFGT